MKTQVIKLDSHDDVTSVRDKMSWAKAERILLVFPPRSRILPRPLDLQLLQRHAATLGAQLAVVSRSFDRRRSAEELFIPAFARIELAHHKSWERENPVPTPVRRNERPDLDQMHREAFPPEAAWRSTFWLRFGFFTLAVLAILAVLSLFIPTATIILNPATGLQSLTLNISASPGVTAVNLAGNLPSRLSSLIMEQSKSIQVTGKVAVPDTRAKGLVVIRNLTTMQIIIPAGTVIRTQSSPPVRFATESNADIEPGIDKKVNVPIQAMEGGTSGNLPADALVSFEGELGASLAVTNPDPTTGGTNKSAPIQTAADRSNLRATLLSEILGQCSPSINQQLAEGDIYFPGTLDVSQVLSESYFPAEDQNGDTLSLTMQVQCQVQYAARQDLDALSNMALDAVLPGGYVTTSADLALRPTSPPITEADGTTHWEMQVQRVLRASLDPLKVVKLSAGRKPTDAAQLLKKTLALSEPPDIHITPAWWPWMPLIPFRITVSTGN